MLPHVWHRHFAHKRALEYQERHLLYLAATPDADATTMAEEEVDPLSTQETFAAAALNPDGTPLETPGQSVDNGVDETRSAVEGALNNPEEDEETEMRVQNFEKLDERIKDAKDKLRILLNQQSGIRKLIRTQTTGKERATHLKEFEDAMLIIEMAQNNLNGYERMTTAILQFKIGAISPEVFEEQYRSALSLGGEGIEGFDVGSVSNELSSINQRKITDLEQKNQRSELMNRVFECDHFKAAGSFVSKQLETIETSIGYVEVYTAGLEESKEFDHKPGMTWSSFWANSMSINDMINGTKKYIEAYKKSYEEWTQLKEARFAQAIGAGFSWIPLGKQTETVLNRQTESANDTVRDEHKQGLEAQKPSFADIVIQIHETKNANPNHFRALLEYAADRAWLYDFDAITGTAFGIQIKNFLPSTWEPANREEYLRELDNKNGSGQDTEKNRGYGRVETIDSIPPLITILRDELNRGNYWAAHGILKRGMEKGKEGETSTWISTTIFRFLRDNPVARKYFPVELLDDLGNIGISHPAWTTTWFKIDRDTIEAWQKTQAIEGADGLKGSGILGSVIGKAEKHLIKEIPSLANDKMALDRYVAQILAGQTVIIGKKKFTIFDNIYKDYRDEMDSSPTSIDPKQADDDFFNAVHNRGSEMILLGKEAYKGILNMQSTGEFFEPVKSGMFLKQLERRADELADIFGENSPEYKVYIEDTGRKMNEWLISNANDSRSATKIGNTKFPSEEDYIILSFVKKKLLSIETLLKLDINKDGTSLGPIVLRQIFDSRPPPVSREKVMRIATEYNAQKRMTDDGLRVIEGICYPDGNPNKTIKKKPSSSREGSSNPTTQAA